MRTLKTFFGIHTKRFHFISYNYLPIYPIYLSIYSIYLSTLLSMICDGRKTGDFVGIKTPIKTPIPIGEASQFEWRPAEGRDEALSSSRLASLRTRRLFAIMRRRRRRRQCRRPLHSPAAGVPIRRRVEWWVDAIGTGQASF